MVPPDSEKPRPIQQHMHYLGGRGVDDGIIERTLHKLDEETFLRTHTQKLQPPLRRPQPSLTLLYKCVCVGHCYSSVVMHQIRNGAMA
jgi:hypothetical protein